MIGRAIIPSILNFFCQTPFRAPGDIYAADFNHDGKSDLLVARIDARLEVFLHGSARTVARSQFPMPLPIYGPTTWITGKLAVRDVDGDYNLDMLVGTTRRSTSPSARPPCAVRNIHVPFMSLRKRALGVGALIDVP